MVDVVIFVPGICGSELMEGAETIWPGTPLEAAFGYYPERYVQALANSTTITAPRILESVPLRIAGVEVWSFDGYGHALKALQAPGTDFSIDAERCFPGLMTGAAISATSPGNCTTAWPLRRCGAEASPSSRIQWAA